MSRHSAMFADKSRTRNTKELLKILWYYISDFKFYLILVALLTLTYTAAVTYQPIIVEQAINGLVAEKSYSSLVVLLLIYLGLSLLSWVAQSLITWYMATVQNDVVHRLREDTFEKLVEADLSYHSKVQSGNITSRVVSDTQEITAGLSIFTTSATNILVAITTLVVLFSISVYFGLISLLALPTAFFITKVISSRGRAKMLKVRSSMGKVSGKLAENLSGVSIAKSFNQEERTSREIRKLNNETYEYFKQLGALMTLIFPSITLVSMIMIAGVLLVGGYLTTTSVMALGSIYLGTVMVRRFLSPILALSNNITNLQTSLAAMDRVADVLSMRPAVTTKEGAAEISVDRGEIVFEDVSFSYGKSLNDSRRGATGGKMVPSPHTPTNSGSSRDDKLVLQKVSFVIPGGKKTGLVGHTGAGKSTITKLILRFYDPDEGRILIDGVDIREVTLDSLYDNIALVSQEPYLFVGTVLENIRYGKPDASDEEVYKICSMVGADEFIEALPEGYHTVLSESGKSLSAGQRQMITIARTMLRDPKILILDEATSRLDAYTESLVQEAQMKLFEGRTTLVIAHRLSTIRDVDQIIVMDDGKAVEVGSHEELMALKGKYYELYRTYYAHQGIEALLV